MTKSLYIKHVDGPIRRCVVKMMLLLGVSFSLSLISEEFGAFLLHATLGAFSVTLYNLIRVKRNVHFGTVTKDEGSSFFVISISDGLEIKVHQDNKRLFVSSDSSGVTDEILLPVGVVYSGK